MANAKTKWPSLVKEGDEAVWACAGHSRPHTDVAPLDPEEIIQTFRDYMIHVIQLVDRGRVARDL
jgi:hypothetical protein